MDVLCLQETHRKDDAKFAKEMDFGFVASSHMCAILSKFPMKEGEEMETESRETNFVVGCTYNT